MATAEGEGVLAEVTGATPSVRSQSPLNDTVLMIARSRIAVIVETTAAM